MTNNLKFSICETSENAICRYSEQLSKTNRRLCSERDCFKYFLTVSTGRSKACLIAQVVRCVKSIIETASLECFRESLLTRMALDFEKIAFSNIKQVYMVRFYMHLYEHYSLNVLSRWSSSNSGIKLHHANRESRLGDLRQSEKRFLWDIKKSGGVHWTERTSIPKSGISMRKSNYYNTRIDHIDYDELKILSQNEIVCAINEKAEVLLGDRSIFKSSDVNHCKTLWKLSVGIKSLGRLHSRYTVIYERQHRTVFFRCLEKVSYSIRGDNQIDHCVFYFQSQRETKCDRAKNSLSGCCPCLIEINFAQSKQFEVHNQKCGKSSVNQRLVAA